MWRGPYLTLGHLEDDACASGEAAPITRLQYLFPPFLLQLILLPGSASQKPDEASTAVFFCSALGDVPCHHPLHLPGDARIYEVWVKHPGQHHSQLAQLLVRPCLPGYPWDLRLSNKMWHSLGLSLATQTKCLCLYFHNRSIQEPRHLHYLISFSQQP